MTGSNTRADNLTDNFSSDSAAEETINAWHSFQTFFLDDWISRRANGFANRANYVNSPYASEKTQYGEDLYKRNNLPIVYKVIECDRHKLLDKMLEDLEYLKLDLTSVQICNDITQNLITPYGIHISERLTRIWKNCLYDCKKIHDMKTKRTIENMLSNITQKIICVHKMERVSNASYTFAGCGYGVVEKGFVGLFDIVVKDEFRGRGYGKEIVEAILSRAKELGAQKAYLAVVNDNEPAKKLYEKFGFKEIYKYWYRKKEYRLRISPKGVVNTSRRLSSLEKNIIARQSFR
jgi:ribosomal protein S18 acetylase RimI-like enzyme